MAARQAYEPVINELLEVAADCLAIDVEQFGGVTMAQKRLAITLAVEPLGGEIVSTDINEKDIKAIRKAMKRDS